MYKIAVMGDRDSIYGFAALGLSVVPAEQPEEAARCLRRLAEEGYGVIYITESLAAQMEEELDRWRSQPLPAVIPFPASGATPAWECAWFTSLWSRR